uniref:DUF4283 domain-containing protein n=1 Tax=Quercus lobata TaxID=97700 RepID=A0A7N2N7G9_QUELO
MGSGELVLQQMDLEFERENHLEERMEDLTHSWQKLSLSSIEGEDMDLSRNKKIQGFALVAKFFSRRSLNVDVVAWTFRPLWRTSGDFHDSDAKHNYVVFTFELEEDVEKVLMGEPWSFDRNLVAFLRYDGSVPIQDLHFERVSFWVQIHHLPFSHLSEEIAFSLGEMIGLVIKTRDASKLTGGIFMHVKDQPRRALVDEKGPNEGVGHSLISPVGNSDETVTKMDGTENAAHDFHNQLQADFSGAIKGIKAVDQVSLISNSKCTTSSIEGKDRGKLIGPSIISTQTMIDHDQILKQGPKRKGDALSKDSTELWEKEKRLKRTEDVGALSIFLGSMEIRERLDKAVASLAWGARFKEARVYHLSNSASDHSPLSLHFFLKQKKRFQRKIFKFKSMWLKDPKCEDIVKNAWEEGSVFVGRFPISRCMELCRNRLEVWNKREFGHVGMKINELQKRLEWLELQAASPATISAIRETRVDLNCWLDRETAMWFQRSCGNWFQAGDQNT